MAKRSPISAWILDISPLNWLLAAVPITAALHFAHAKDLYVFLFSGLAIIPLAGLMGRATENLAETMGSGIGGLLNATFGNAAELIIALMVLRKGPPMYPLVKASITGSIIGNVLLVLGLAVMLGGIRYPRQTFNRTAAGTGTTLLALACTGLIVPTIFFYVFRADPQLLQPQERQNIASLSEEIALVLAGVYVISLFFSLRTHKHLFAADDDKAREPGHGPEWGRQKSLLVLATATVGVAVMSEFLVGSVENAGKALGLSDVFLGVIVVAIIGNAAEHSTAVLMAMKNKMDLAVNIALGSSIQIALFVAPVLVFASMLMGHEHHMNLHFTLMEMLVMVLSVALLALIVLDGETHWMEGVLLLAVYFIFGLAFYHLPEVAH